MFLSNICIKRPVLATVLNLLIILIGLVSYQRLSVREYPKVDSPTVSVETHYPGANSQIIESQVTIPLEDSLSGIEGIDYISSSSRDGQSAITVSFIPTRDVDSSAGDVRDRVSRARGTLPADIDEPVIAKVEADAEPIIWIALYGENHDPMEVSDYADRVVKDQLQLVPGVSQVMIFGERKYSMRIWLDRVRMAAYSMTVQDIENALRKQNIEIPSGRIESIEREFTVLAQTDLRTVEEFQDIVLRDEQGYLVRLKDVARVEIGPRDERGVARYKQIDAMGIGIIKQSTANPLEVSNGVRKRLPSILENLPQGMRLEVAYDSSIFIRESINEVFVTIFEAIALVVLVIFVFLRTVRATFIPLVTIPVSLTGALIFMHLFGFSINTLTLLAFVLAIGLVVDDAIVVLENIYRHIEEGLSPMQAAFKGIKEIAFAVIAMTITLAAVFTPIAFATGRTGKLFSEFALTLAGAVLISGFVALSLSPMMSSRLLKSNADNRFYQWGERWLNKLSSKYQSLLSFSLKHRGVVLSFALIVALSCGFFIKILPAELAPIEDQGWFLGWGMAPEGSTIEYVDKAAKKMEQLIDAVPEVDRYFLAGGFPSTTNAISFIGLKPWAERKRSSMEIVQELQPQFFMIPPILAFPITPSSLGASPFEQPVGFIVQTTGSYDDLNKILNSIVEKSHQYPGLINIDTDLKLNKPELKVSVNREKAASMGVDIDTIGRTLETMLGGREVTHFKMKAQQYDVMLQVDPESRRLPQDMNQIYVRNVVGEMIPLANLVSIEETVAPKELNHFNKLRSAVISAGLAEGFKLGDALEFLEQTVKQTEGVDSFDYSASSREFKSSSQNMAWIFLLGIGFIYLVLSAQFESFISPFIILLTVPLASAGALFSLKLTGGSLSIYSQIGLLTLVGLITKHGILIVEFANQLLHAGNISRFEAVTKAATIRLRPILMTTGAMVLGALPLAVATGAGAHGRQQMGWVIVGGMLFGTLLTLFVVPTIYSFVVREPKVEHS